MRKKEKMSPSEDFVSGAGSARTSLNGSYDDTVRQRAYEIYESRLATNAYGDPESDWLQAEEQVRSRHRSEDAVS